MENKELIGDLEKLLRDFLDAQSLELVEFSCHHAGPNMVIRLLVDKPAGGITIGECSLANRRIGALLEEKAIIQENYILEVNSPGLDRPLQTKRDFSRCLGRKVKFFLIEPINGKIETDGIVSQVSEEGVTIEAVNGVCLIAFSKIRKAKQIF